MKWMDNTANAEVGRLLEVMCPCCDAPLIVKGPNKMPEDWRVVECLRCMFYFTEKLSSSRSLEDQVTIVDWWWRERLDSEKE